MVFLVILLFELTTLKNLSMKNTYFTPQCAMVDIRQEGVICLSFGSDELPGFEFSTMSATPLSEELPDLEVIY